MLVLFIQTSGYFCVFGCSSLGILYLLILIYVAQKSAYSFLKQIILGALTSGMSSYLPKRYFKKTFEWFDFLNFLSTCSLMLLYWNAGLVLLRTANCITPTCGMGAWHIFFLLPNPKPHSPLFRFTCLYT